MRILHVIRDLSPATGGPVTAVLGMAAAESTLGNAVTIITTDHGLDALPREHGVGFKVFPCRLHGWRWSRELSQGLPVFIRNSDIVHIHTIWEHPTWVAAKICEKLEKPYVLRPCGMLDKWSLSRSAWKKKAYLHLLAASVIRRAAALHFTSEEELNNSLIMGSEDRGFVIPNGLPLSIFQDIPGPHLFRRRFPELEDKRIVLFLGRLHYKKQPESAIKAFHKVRGIDGRLVLVLAGPAEPAYLAELRALVRDLRVSDRVVFTGLLQGAAIREAFHAAELFVLPSLQENFGIAVAEAMAAGCPVIVSEPVNLSSEIRSADAGVVCKSDVDSIAAAMEQLIKDDSLRALMGENGRCLVSGKFMWPQAAGRLLHVYEDVIASNRTSPDWRGKFSPRELSN